MEQTSASFFCFSASHFFVVFVFKIYVFFVDKFFYYYHFSNTLFFNMFLTAAIYFFCSKFILKMPSGTNQVTDWYNVPTILFALDHYCIFYFIFKLIFSLLLLQCHSPFIFKKFAPFFLPSKKI